MEIDILVEIDGREFAVEYDGEFHHGAQGARGKEAKKEAILRELEIPLLRLREGSLPPVFGAGVASITVGTAGSVKPTVDAVLRWLESELGSEHPRVASYLAADKEQYAADAENYLRAVGNELRPRRKPPRGPRKIRGVKDPFQLGTKIGTIEVVDGPIFDETATRAPDRWQYEVKCSCGNVRRFNHWTLRHQPPKTCGSAHGQ